MSTPQNLPSTDELAAHARKAVRKVGDHFTEQAGQLRDSAADVRYNAENFIQNNPWPSVALAAGIGFLLGVVLSRR